jgi:integrase
MVLRGPAPLKFPLEFIAIRPKWSVRAALLPTQMRVSLWVSTTTRCPHVPLTDAKIRSAKPQHRPYKISDAKGLYLEVRPTGAKLWRYRYRIAGKENVFAIGVYGAGQDCLGLAAAREQLEHARKLVKQGQHPSHERQAKHRQNVEDGANTFRAIGQDWFNAHRVRWTAYYAQQIERGLREDIYPVIGSLPIRNVNAHHALRIVKAAETRGAEVVAVNLRQWGSAVFRYAIQHLKADNDPFAAVKGAVVRPPVKHKEPFSFAEIADFLNRLASYSGHRETVIALRLLLLLWTRPGELRQARWSEFDLATGTWSIPAHRMKMRREHTVPLPHQAIVCLRELHALTGDRDVLFPNLRDSKRCMSATTLNRALENLGYGGRFSAHAFRTTASTLLNEKAERPDVIERQLAHVDGNKSRAAYNRSEYLAERSDMLQRWADLLDRVEAGGAEIVPIGIGRRAVA